MTQEEKELLIKDISARSPYGLKCKVRYWDGSGRLYVTGDMTLIGIIGNTCVFKTNFIRESTMSVDISDVKPYLRPLSSMTEEERKEINKSYNFSDFGSITIRYHMEGWWDNDTECSLKDYLYLINWLNKHHFDYQGLIEKGLALEAPEGMYK